MVVHERGRRTIPFVTQIERNSVALAGANVHAGKATPRILPLHAALLEGISSLRSL